MLIFPLKPLAYLGKFTPIYHLYKRRTKEIKQICGNCQLYDSKKGICSVKVLVEGQQLELPVIPTDKCYWIENGIDIQQVREWSDGEKGYIELPEAK